MITKLTGIVTEVQDQSVVLEREGIGYEVLVPGYAVGELAAHRGREVVFHTLEFLEGNSANGNLVPRLVGFLHPEDKAFFSRFIGVKGIGPRKALRALSEPIAKVANWINDRELRLLATLPGIGRRGAEMIVAELKGKVDEFASGTASVSAGTTEGCAQPRQDALEVMLAWGDGRNDAVRWLERAAQLHPDLSSADEWVRSCYRIKAGAEG